MSVTAVGISSRSLVCTSKDLNVCVRAAVREPRTRDATMVARLPLSSPGGGNEAYGPASRAPSKTDVHKQTKWQQTGGGKEEGGGRGGGEMPYSSGMFSCSVLMPHKWELFPPVVQHTV